MSLRHDDPQFVLLFGRDPELLETRADVLRSTGISVDIAAGLRDLKDRVDHTSSNYGVVVCCHTATDAECEEVIAIAIRNGIAFLNLECFTAPLELIERVSSVINERRLGRGSSSP